MNRNHPERKICVFTGSRHGASSAYADAAEQLARDLVERGFGLVYGGGNVGLLNVSGYYDPLIEFLDHAVSQDFVKPKHRALLIVEHDPMTLLDRFAKILAAPPVKQFDPSIT